MNPVKISVLLPFYNPGSFFREAIDSVLSQDFQDFELILVNNNSDTASIQTAREYAKSDRRIILLNEPVQGISQALNTGLLHSNGTFIARMDADDICLPGRLKIQHEYLLHNPGVGVISGLVRPLLEEANEGMMHYIRQNNALISPEKIYNHRFVETPFIHPTVMFCKKLIEDYGSYSTDSVPEDYELWLRWFSKNVKMHKLPVDVLAWRDHSARLTRIHSDYAREAFRRVRIHYLAEWLKKQTNLPPIWIWGGGKYSRQGAALLLKKGINIHGFIDVDPERKIEGFRVLHFTSLPPQGCAFIISMVSNRDKFSEVYDYLYARNYVSDQDFILAS